MKKFKCAKKYGIWYYIKMIPNAYNDLDGAIYELYNEKKEFVGTFGSLDSIKYYVETGIML